MCACGPFQRRTKHNPLLDADGDDDAPPPFTFQKAAISTFNVVVQNNASMMPVGKDLPRLMGKMSINGQKISPDMIDLGDRLLAIIRLLYDSLTPVRPPNYVTMAQAAPNHHINNSNNNNNHSSPISSSSQSSSPLIFPSRRQQQQQQQQPSTNALSSSSNNSSSNSSLSSMNRSNSRGNMNQHNNNNNNNNHVRGGSGGSGGSSDKMSILKSFFDNCQESDIENHEWLQRVIIETFSEEHPLFQVLRACNQSAIAQSVIFLKQMIQNKCKKEYKDKDWMIDVRVINEPSIRENNSTTKQTVTVTHNRGEKIMQKNDQEHQLVQWFLFRWSVVFTFQRRFNAFSVDMAPLDLVSIGLKYIGAEEFNHKIRIEKSDRERFGSIEKIDQFLGTLFAKFAQEYRYVQTSDELI